MAEKVKEHDFIELSYTGRLADGTVFDTTLKEVAEKKGLTTQNKKFGPLTVCVGEKQLLPGLDEELVGKEIGKDFIVELSQEKAFGKRDVKKIQLVPLSTFKEHKLNPYPGLQVDFDGKIGTVMRATGGRVMVNFNHPLAGKDIVYECKVVGTVTDLKEQILTYISTGLQIDAKFVEVSIDGEKAVIKVPFEMPAPIVEMLQKKLTEITKVKEVTFESSAEKMTAPQA